MTHLIHHSVCPVCGSNQLHQVLTAKDFTVSKEEFVILQCNNCLLRFTQDIPDQQAIAPYYQSAAYISHSNTKKGIVNRLYHIARIFTMSSKEAVVKKAVGKPTGMMLDIGSGTGVFVKTMMKAGWDVIGIEPDEQARAFAMAQHKVDLSAANELFNLPYGTYDAITMWHVLEHVHQLQEYVNHLKNLLAPGGKLIVAVPNYTSKDANTYKQHWAAYDVPRHLYHFSPTSVKALMEQHDMQVAAIHPMWLDSYYVSMLSEKYRGGNFIKAIWNGFLSTINTIQHREQCSSLIYIVEQKPAAA
jgi:2-polyprenyl-3-methyl-5-hydroxy-6-metoxy-1,4-benzoquinol methylase